MTFKVMTTLCDTCIYKKGLGWDIKRLEAEVKDKYIGFKGWRECHHAERGSGVCCRGFWNAHKDEFQAGQIAQRMKLVEFVEP
jgi:hypothetical protein